MEKSKTILFQCILQIRCTKKECEPKPAEKSGHKIVEKQSADGCCTEYESVPDDCVTTDCPYQAPRCRHYEDVVSYAMDKCCFTYECKCNPAKCPQLGSPPCPQGKSHVQLSWKLPLTACFTRRLLIGMLNMYVIYLGKYPAECFLLMRSVRTSF